MRVLRKALKLPDRYRLIPFPEGRPSLAASQPFGFEAMQLQMDRSGTQTLVDGITSFLLELHASFCSFR